MVTVSLGEIWGGEGNTQVSPVRQAGTLPGTVSRNTGAVVTQKIPTELALLVGLRVLLAVLNK